MKRSVINIYICFFVGVLLPSLYFGYVYLIGNIFILVWKATTSDCDSICRSIRHVLPSIHHPIGPLNPFLVESLIVVVIFVLVSSFLPSHSLVSQFHYPSIPLFMYISYHIPFYPHLFGACSFDTHACSPTLLCWSSSTSLYSIYFRIWTYSTGFYFICLQSWLSL